MGRMRKGTARVEFFTIRDELEELLSNGYNIKLAHEKLLGEGKITMSYRGFYDNYRAVLGEKLRKKKAPMPAAAEKPKLSNKEKRVINPKGDPVDHIHGTAIEGREHELLDYYAERGEDVPEGLHEAVRKAFPNWNPQK